MTINITQRNMERSEAVEGYVEKKMRTLEKYFHPITHMDVTVGLITHHHQTGKIFECHATLEYGGRVARIEKEAEDLYKAIDKVRDHLREELSSEKKRIADTRAGRTDKKRNAA